MRTLITDPFEDDAKEILEWAYGSLAAFTFHDKMSTGERAGQAFMNTLYTFDHPSYTRLTSSKADPFYDDNRLPAALDRLTSK